MNWSSQAENIKLFLTCVLLSFKIEEYKTGWIKTMYKALSLLLVSEMRLVFECQTLSHVSALNYSTELFQWISWISSVNGRLRIGFPNCNLLKKKIIEILQICVSFNLNLPTCHTIIQLKYSGILLQVKPPLPVL